jgi:hypothetical protein
MNANGGYQRERVVEILPSARYESVAGLNHGTPHLASHRAGKDVQDFCCTSDYVFPWTPVFQSLKHPRLAAFA